MLEVNIYDNFNPNYYNISDYKLPNGNIVQRPLPAPKARAVAMNYELWETGYLYTSTATLSITAEIGDVVEILFPEKIPLETSLNNINDFDLSFFYVVTDVSDGNQVTLENYFWNSINAMDIPNNITKTTNFAIINYMIDANKANNMVYGYLFNSTVFGGKATINRKAETAEAKDVAKRVFASVQYQPTALMYHKTTDSSGQIVDPRRIILINFSSRSWNRKRITTRIDDKHNVVSDTETVVERSNYNFAIVFVKNATTEDYTDPPKMYTVKDDGSVINYSTYTGDGTDLPTQRIMKTLFYDEEPSNATIKAEITPSTIVTRLIFDADPLLPLYTNDLVDLWYNNTLYSGYIADRMKTDTQDRIVFVEGVQ